MPVAYSWKRCLIPVLAAVIVALIGMPTRVYALVGDVPAMPKSESSDPGSMNGSSTTGGGSSSGDPSSGGGSTSPPAAPEPTALLTGLLGCGLTGAYALYRRRASSESVAERAAPADPVGPVAPSGGRASNTGSSS
jgi:hypothetical protein